MTKRTTSLPGDLTRENIVCFSTADWDTLLPTNKHHLMRRLAQRGNRVLYIETLGTRRPIISSGTDISRISRRLLRGFQGPRRREKRLWSVSPVVRPVWTTGTQIAMNRAAFRVQLGGALSHFPNPIAWVYSPYASHLLDIVRPRCVVYHMVDDLSAVPGAVAETVREAESRMLARADVVFCTEQSLYDRARRVSQNVWWMPNVADYTHFARDTASGADTRLVRLKSLPRPRLLFSGNLTPHKVDFELIDAIAAARPGWQVILVGPEWEGTGKTAPLASLKKRRNVTFTGHVPYEELPGFLHAADILLIPYVLNDATRAVFPLKMFEYLSTGRPVVSSPLPSLLPYRGAVRIADSLDSWLAECEGAFADSHEMEVQRRALARRHTWERRLTEMSGRVAEVLAQKNR